jgi:hypothetical protein
MLVSQSHDSANQRFAADGFLPAEQLPPHGPDELNRLTRLLAADQGDTGCEVAFQALDRYAEADLAGSDPREHFPGLAAHLAGCSACGQDYQRLLAAAGSAERQPA